MLEHLVVRASVCLPSDGRQSRQRPGHFAGLHGGRECAHEIGVTTSIDRNQGVVPPIPDVGRQICVKPWLPVQATLGSASCIRRFFLHTTARSRDD
jgi:hypothetical protein